ncbi:MAG: hypothetical protein PGN24_03745 [Microbacterium arborescens]
MRARPAVLDEPSIVASAAQTTERTSEVQVVILDIFAKAGALTDDQLVALYEARVEAYPGLPRATPQSVRTRRSELAHRGLVQSLAERGVSRYGNPCTMWTLAEPRKR